MALVVLVTGRRTWDDYGVVAREIDALPPDAEVVTCGFVGLDAYTKEYALGRGRRVTEPPYRGGLSSRGGIAVQYLIRKRREGHDVLVLVIHDNLEGDRFGHTPQVVR